MDEKNKKSSVPQQIRDYIQNNYSNTNLSVSQIAYHFGYHENYVSKLYRSRYGENLFAAIEKIRTGQACLLLDTTQLKISQIAEKVGYVSDSSFRRAFKRNTGYSPTEYKLRG